MILLWRGFFVAPGSRGTPARMDGATKISIRTRSGAATAALAAASPPNECPIKTMESSEGHTLPPLLALLRGLTDPLASSSSSSSSAEISVTILSPHISLSLFPSSSISVSSQWREREWSLTNRPTAASTSDE